MKSTNRKPGLILTGMMGTFTILLCLAVADGMIGLHQPPAGTHLGAVLFWTGMIVLPLLFYRWVKWRDTLLNLPLYFLLYFPVYERFGLEHTHYSLETGGLIAFPAYWGAILVAVVFWGIQSLVCLIVNIISYATRKANSSSYQV